MRPNAIVDTLPAAPPFTLRARLLSPLGGGGYANEPDALVSVEESGRIERIAPLGGQPAESAYDARPLLLLPGLIDTHVHLPQIPMAGTGFGIRIMDWLPQVMHPIERGFDEEASRRLSPVYFQAFAAAGTTTGCIYTSVDLGAVHAAFAAAEAHGMRVIMGQPLMDKLRYDHDIPDDRVTEVRLREAAETCERWHGMDEGRIQYAFTPRWALQSSRELMAGSAHLAREMDAYWQTHIAEDHGEPASVAAEFPEAIDFLDVYDRAGGLGPRSVLAHAVHLNDRELARVKQTGTALAHCPASNIYLGGGIMRLARYRELGLKVGLGTDVAGGWSLSLFVAMQAGAISQNARALFLGDAEGDVTGRLGPLEWLRLATLDGAAALGLEDQIGSLESGKEADMVLVDPDLASPLPGDAVAELDRTDLVLGRMMFRPHPDMVRAAWVRGRRLAGPADWEPG
jgi:guanine deaminase